MGPACYNSGRLGFSLTQKGQEVRQLIWALLATGNFVYIIMQLLQVCWQPRRKLLQDMTDQRWDISIVGTTMTEEDYDANQKELRFITVVVQSLMRNKYATIFGPRKRFLKSGCPNL